ncbi:MAG TPA: tyrosine--tRNA ligase [Candidatus Dependentiae bacterium]|nr:tyrosine--tRNA ligase [Candidatus Dependentiae bacterium]HRQ62951.1 tyrosine--tRNA ligase [Candidatus Dependentiae bacterium]
MKKELALIEQGTAQVIPEKELVQKLKTGKKLKVKLGMDPTAPDLHLGHAVVLSKLKTFQDLGHEVIFVIGDFTARIGDPTGRSKTRPALSAQDIEHNMRTYFEQVGKILDPKNLTIRYNSEWLDTLSASDVVQICAKVTLARLTEREDFANRIKDNQPISFHELLYPLFQAYDSVALQADIELGGTDQTFNLLMGRFLQEQYGQTPQVVITCPLLEGLDGVKKMSKSLGNAIGIAEAADDAFGKLMSISDTLMWRYFKLLLNIPDDAISAMQERVAYGNTHPMALKKQMAHDIVAKFWSQNEATKAQETFEALFQKKDYSQAQEVSLTHIANPIWVVELLKTIGAISSSSEAKRLIESKAVLIDGQVVTDFKHEVQWQSGMVIKVGKHRIYKIS